jgi:hypothetical protein
MTNPLQPPAPISEMQMLQMDLRCAMEFDARDGGGRRALCHVTTKKGFESTIQR